MDRRRCDCGPREEREDALLIDIAVAGDVRVEEKEEERVTKYQCLAHEVKRLWQLKATVKVMIVIVGTLGAISKNSRSWSSL